MFSGVQTTSCRPDFGSISTGVQYPRVVGERPPHLLAGAAVERDHAAVRLRPDMDDHAVAVDHRRAGEAPHRHPGAALLRPCPAPRRPCRWRRRGRSRWPTAPRVYSLPSWTVGRGPRAVGVPAEVAVLHRVLVRPERLAGRGVEAEHPLVAVRLVALRRLDRVFQVEGVDLAAGNCDPRVPAADGLSPDDLRPAGRPLVGELRSVPGAVAARPAPPRPVLRGYEPRTQNNRGNGGSDHAFTVSGEPWLAPSAASMNATISSVSDCFL